VQIGVADTGVFDVDEDFIGTGLLDGNLLIGCDWAIVSMKDI
jgi:hypothetical protein